MSADAPREPEILGVDRLEDRVRLRLRIGPSLFYFRGHFPGRPILPGVVQLHWAIDYGRRQFGLVAARAETFQVKYRNVIRPGEEIALELRYRPDRRRLAFEYSGGDRVRSSGQVTLAA